MQHGIRLPDEVLEQALVTADLGQHAQGAIDEPVDRDFLSLGPGQAGHDVDDMAHSLRLQRIDLLKPVVVLDGLDPGVVGVGVGGAGTGENDFLPEVVGFHGQVHQGKPGVEADQFLRIQEALHCQICVLRPSIIGYPEHAVRGATDQGGDRNAVGLLVL